MEQLIDILIIADKLKAGFPWGAVISGVSLLGGSIFGSSSASKRAKDENARRDRLTK